MYVGSDQTPLHIAARYFCQSWTVVDDYSEHYGILTEAKISVHWSARAGVFRSIYDLPKNYSDLYENTLSNGAADHTIVAEPNQYYTSTSGEIQITGLFKQGAWHQRLDIGVRGRDDNARYGGSETINLGVGVAGKIEPLALPEYQFAATTTNCTSEYSTGISYALGWHHGAEVTVGVQRPAYSRTVEDPIPGRSTTSANPWIYNSNITFNQTSTLTVFGAMTRGLEDSGVAPAGAENRGAVTRRPTRATEVTREKSDER